MKRILSLILAVVMVLSMAGCGIEPGPDSSAPESRSSQQTVQVDNSTDEKQPEATPTPEPTPTAKPTPTPKATPKPTAKPTPTPEKEQLIDEDGRYFDKENVALYIHTYGHLPDNFITKDEARDLGWEGGSVEKYAPGCAIGGDRFGNFEGLLPKAKGRTYYECDIDTDGYHSRGSRRIVFSNDGLIYYTHDHYESFELLYGEE